MEPLSKVVRAIGCLVLCALSPLTAQNPGSPEATLPTAPSAAPSPQDPTGAAPPPSLEERIELLERLHGVQGRKHSFHAFDHPLTRAMNQPAPYQPPTAAPTSGPKPWMFYGLLFAMTLAGIVATTRFDRLNKRVAALEKWLSDSSSGSGGGSPPR